MLPSLKCEEQFGDLSLCRFLISLRNSRAIMTVTLASLAYGPRHSCLSPWYADFEKSSRLAAFRPSTCRGHRVFRICKHLTLLVFVSAHDGQHARCLLRIARIL